jgi:hypothetical protein
MIPFMGLSPSECLNLRPDTTSLFPTTKKDFSNGIVVFSLSGLIIPFSSRFGMHAFDAKAVDVLRFRVSISSEENALYCHFMHDIGHGPFSHAMEKSIVEDVHHEEISLLFMHQLNVEFNGPAEFGHSGV